MKKLLAFIVFVFSFTSPEYSLAAKNYRIVVFGDSVTAGQQLGVQEAFPARLEQKLRAAGYDQVEVINMSAPNATTASATAETEAVLRKLPDVIIVQLGYNDTKRGVLASAVGSNLNRILADLKRDNAYIILAGIRSANTADENYAAQIEGYFYNLALSQRVPLYPSIVAGIAGNPSLTTADGIHPNAAGVEVMVNGIFPLVDKGLRWRYELYHRENDDTMKARQRQGQITAPPPP